MLKIRDIFDSTRRVLKPTWLIALFALLTILFPVRNAQVGSRHLLDGHFWYTRDDVTILFNSLSESGRNLYAWSEVTLDVLYPLVYALTAIVIMLSLFGEDWNRRLAKFLEKEFDKKKDWAARLTAIPLMAAVADLTENALIAMMAWSFDGTEPALASAAVVASRAKWILVCLTLATVAIVVVFAVRDWLRKKTPAANCVEEEEVLGAEHCEIWRGRLRRQLPFPPLAELKSEPVVLSWLSDALAIAGCIKDIHSRGKAKRAVRERCGTLLSDYANLGPVDPNDAGWVDAVHQGLLDLDDTQTLKKIFKRRRVGLALSGGGIRSASFNLGVLESLHKHRALDHMDYLSTVSGGGYTGAALTFHSARDRLGFPFADPDKELRKSRTDWIRAHASYLNSGREVGTLTLIASVVRGIGLNLLFIVPLFFGIMWLLTLGCDGTAGLCLDCDGPRVFLRQPLGLALAIAGAVAVFFAFQKAKGRRVSEKFRIGFISVMVLWLIAFAVALGLSLEAVYAKLGVVTYLLIVGPLAVLGLRTLIGAFPGTWSGLRKRLEIVTTEIFAWMVVAGSMYFIMQRLPLEEPYPLGHLWLAAVGMVLLLKLAANFILMTLLSSSASRFNPVEQRSFSVQFGDLLGMGAIFLVLGALPLIDQLLRAVWDQYSGQFLSGLTVAGVISTAGGWLQRSSGNENKGYVAFLLRFGVTVLIGACLLWMYRLAVGAHGPGGFLATWQWLLIGLVWVVAAIVSDLNYMSMHRYYRNRLADAFLVDPAQEAVIDVAEKSGWRITEEAAAYLRLRSRAKPKYRQSLLKSIAKSQKLKHRQVLELHHAMSHLKDPAWVMMIDSSSPEEKLTLLPDARAYLSARVGLDKQLREEVFTRLRSTEESRKKWWHARFFKKKPSERTITLAKAKAAIREGHLHGMRLEADSDLRLCQLDAGQSGAPYHIINTNLVLPGSRSEAYRVRRGDSFIFSPRYIGSKATLWERSDSENCRASKLATAMAISGAAVDPNTGVTMSMPLRIIMTLLNVRLGYWQTRPGCEANILSRLITESWPTLVVREMFGRMHEDSDHVRLSDGGHFENLGLYELVRRRCDRIVVCDAAADPNFGFGDLARAVERVRVDFGADIELDTAYLQPKGKKRQSRSPCVRGMIKYRNPDKEAEIVMIKSTLFSGLSEDILGYARAHTTFPDETTADQFFSEEQFEAYRQLGFRAAEHTASNIAWLNRTD